jgi:hypothetical protein
MMKFEDSSILEAWKGEASHKGPRQRKFKPNTEVTKLDHLIWNSGLSGFPKIDKV